jgi:glutathione S-transferase/maleylpyruvate isomerase
LLLEKNPLDTNKLWLCDCGFTVTFAWIRAFQDAVNLPVEWPQIVTDYETRLKEFEVVSGELEAYRPAMDAYLEKAKPA